jgi:hypothetical protein
VPDGRQARMPTIGIGIGIGIEATASINAPAGT